ncbi:signal recognition particle protein [Truepera radiovictrix]|uniref:Signal recognition particle protein n=1 Tax=Truepera radiovictrix (strain DSM 17093 / CIP 108686 / LMG 22925 / RQ-24) TaxID=649638 RepID=D7CX91_TRURR|nr:signal recognition particle protein [Truepera radiovictrix]ADI13215.1 signal recognition particle protein [Truepera radiovictrix DSM 17093]WMT58220.1 signal recognition particle protein [Truepera radiovictrix]
MFESLGDRLQGVFDSLRGRGRLTEDEVRAALREVRVALLEADVSLEVARDFTKRVQEKAVGSETLMSLQPDQRVIAIVHDELVELLGGKTAQPSLKNDANVWLLLGLQGAGKTTTAGKLAYKYKAQGRRPLLVAADTQRPAAREQLRVLGKQIGVPVLEVEDHETPARTRARLQEVLRTTYHDLVIVDTAGRLQIDEALMDAVAELKAELSPSETMLVIDAMTGQQSLPVAKTFDERVGVTGLIMTKLDGDARGGAALSARHVTGKPIYFAGMSEKIDGLEAFHPDRIAGRILGMGDVLTLIEKAKALEGDDEADAAATLKDFSLQDMLTQMQKIKRMGSFTEILKMIPGASRLLPPGAEIDEREIARIEAIISSMTERERRQPKLLNASRRKRIAAGSGTSVQDVNRLMKNYEQMKKVMKQLGRRPPGRGLPGRGLGR